METTRYAWAGKATYGGVVPERAAELFRKIEKRDGSLTPAGLVEASRPETALMHRAFEWDDAKAAECYRHTQARQIIGSLVEIEVMPSGKELETRAYVSVVRMGATVAADHEDETVTGYLNVQTVLADDVLHKQYLRACARELASIRRRYSDLKELSEAFNAIDKVLAEIQAA